MKINIHSSFLDPVFLIVTGILIILGSVGIFKDVCIPLSLTAILFFFGTKLIRGAKIKFPPTYAVYMIFVLTVLTHTLLSGGKIIYFWMFLTGGLFWVLAFNMKDLVKRYLFYFLIFLGLLMSIIYLYLKVRGINYFSPDNLFLPFNSLVKHNHLGDLWAVILIPAIYSIVKKFNLGLSVLIAVGLGLISLSLSRSAIVSLAAGLTFLIVQMQKARYIKFNLKQKKLGLIFIFLACFSLIVYFGTQKSILSSRPYFREALTALFTVPLGLGMGNFTKVSAETNVVHNIVLEVVSGMGIFSMVFIFWLYKVFKMIFEKSTQNIEFKAVWLALFANFFFDSTYVIPGMLWLWFTVISLVTE